MCCDCMQRAEVISLLFVRQYLLINIMYVNKISLCMLTSLLLKIVWVHSLFDINFVVLYHNLR